MRNVTKRKTDYRVHEILPNGQHLNLYFTRMKSGDFIKQWHVSLVISSNRKEANQWFSKKGKEISTGNCGLVGLRRALFLILEFRKKLRWNEEIVVAWEDDKRKRAYQYLKRFGFVRGFDGDEYTGLITRNPDIWVLEE